jgi:hypothetical protein
VQRPSGKAAVTPQEIQAGKNNIAADRDNNLAGSPVKVYASIICGVNGLQVGWLDFAGQSSAARARSEGVLNGLCGQGYRLAGTLPGPPEKVRRAMLAIALSLLCIMPHGQFNTVLHRDHNTTSSPLQINSAC